MSRRPDLAFLDFSTWIIEHASGHIQEEMQETKVPCIFSFPSPFLLPVVSCICWIIMFLLKSKMDRMCNSLISQPDSRKFLQQLLVQSQFSLGCALSCSLNYLHEGASQRWLCLLLTAALSWFLARQAASLLHHVTALYKLHSSQNYCGICISLLTSGWYLLPMLCRTMTITFFVAVLAAVSIINQQFLSATEALRFWTPLTICYTLLVVYMQEEQHCLPSSQAVFNAVVVRLGGLMVLMLTVGRWADVLHILMCFLGEAGCLIPANDLLNAASSQDEEDFTNYARRNRRQKPKPHQKEQQR